jgi:hypothetical protein
MVAAIVVYLYLFNLQVVNLQVSMKSMISGQKGVSVTPKCRNLFEDFSTGMSLRTSLVFVTWCMTYRRLLRRIFVLWTGQKVHALLHVSTQFLYSIKRSLLSGIFQVENVEVR